MRVPSIPVAIGNLRLLGIQWQSILSQPARLVRRSTAFTEDMADIQLGAHSSFLQELQGSESSERSQNACRRAPEAPN